MTIPFCSTENDRRRLLPRERERARPEGKRRRKMLIHGGRFAVGAQSTMRGSVQIAGGRVTRILTEPSSMPTSAPGRTEVDLSGFLVMPGLINAHDHLQFGLFPRLGNPPYQNYVEWGDDIHRTFPEVIAKYRAVPKHVRLWWGGIRNLLCGVTTVAHHDPLWPDLQREDFPVRVVQEYGWGHSVALGGDLQAAHSTTPDGRSFIVHACEGVDETARKELWDLDRLKLLDDKTVLVHGLAIDSDGVALMRDRQASLITCPSSNRFLFGRLPDISILGAIDAVALGNDSPLTAEGDLLDEIRFAISSCNIPSQMAYRMVTEAPAKILRLLNGEGSIRVFGLGDLIAVRDTGADPADRLSTLSMDDVEFVVLNGAVQLASQDIVERLPYSAQQGLEPLSLGDTVRWLRAPVQDLLRKAEDVLGKGEVKLGNRVVCLPT